MPLAAQLNKLKHGNMQLACRTPELLFFTEKITAHQIYTIFLATWIPCPHYTTAFPFSHESFMSKSLIQLEKNIYITSVWFKWGLVFAVLRTELVSTLWGARVSYGISWSCKIQLFHPPRHRGSDEPQASYCSAGLCKLIRGKPSASEGREKNSHQGKRQKV